MNVTFTKMTGAGNDFVVIDDRRRRIRNGPKAAKLLCDRKWGIGADGLLLLQKSRRAAYKMMYYNADGSYGGMCGNGGRCIAFYAFSGKIASRIHRFEALDHIYCATVSRTEVILTMKDPRNALLSLEIVLESNRLPVSFIDTGSPHVVVPIESLKGAASVDDVDVLRLGRMIRHHEHFAPSGTNVNFIERSGPNSIRVRTFERGVEDETLACGTGSIASAIMAARQWNIIPPVTVIPKSRMPLWVDFSEIDGSIRNVRLAGPAKVVYTGLVEL
ncbi:MAG: Diaminopimelate epimerase [Bacteroidetes bacterium]|nr:Diaminopimelate epimerase [Bacteroidota bacterium]